MVRFLSIAAIGAALALAACSSGPSWDTPGHTVSTSDHTSDMDQAGAASGNAATAQDKDFVAAAAAGGAYEIQASQVALQKTQSPRIRMIAQRMIHDHTAAGHQLTKIARKEGIPAANTPTADQQQMISQLNGLNGDSFDHEYLTQQKTAHQQTIDLFRQESADGNDPQLKTFATNTLPTLQEHLNMITSADNAADNNNGNTMNMNQK